jgi:hypothetical protein
MSFMPSIGLERIRALYTRVPGTDALTEADNDAEAIGVVQDFLIEQKFLRVPSHREESRHGKFDRATKNALRTFFGIKSTQDIVLDSPKIVRLINEPPKSARGRLGRMSIKLGFPVTKQLKLLSLVSLFEGGFSTLNLNTDMAGLSYGLIQWAQSKGRLKEIVVAMQGDANKAGAEELFNSTFGGTAEGMIKHISDPTNNFGVKADGTTTDSKFDLISPEWTKRFISAGEKVIFQKTQVRLALEDFDSIVTFVQGYVDRAKIKSQRAIAFMVDLSNQFGRGDHPTLLRGAKKIYKEIEADATNETDALRRMADKAVAMIQPEFRRSARERRDFFRSTGFLNDDPF